MTIQIQFFLDDPDQILELFEIKDLLKRAQGRLTFPLDLVITNQLTAPLKAHYVLVLGKDAEKIADVLEKEGKAPIVFNPKHNLEVNVNRLLSIVKGL